ncbi:glycosyltransferase BC10-like [Prosopis cineraria]|uniref:glycosyltransferase BC10-like n=1 Tax=Prosopis cineraria TaxID=364024 RepID=UPI0024105757|nr:glycosyltransferase BC10-like [Prosopis cineraria]
MGNELKHSPFVAQLLGSKLPFTYLLRFLFFVIGLSLGVTISVYFKSFSFSLKELFPSSPPGLPELPPPQPWIQPSLNGSGSYTQQPLMHNMDDEELFWRALMVPKRKKFQGEHVPKIAFMFLTKGPLHLAPLWEMFFKGHQGLYTIYVHTHPLFNWTVPVDSVFYRTRIPSKTVTWGQPSMLDAERRLLANALLDFYNERFVLLSETCIPLFNFTTIYNFLVNANHGFVASYDDPRKTGRGRYNPKMAPTIKISDWRKGSQWFEMNRKMAIEIVSDTKYYLIFNELCSPPCYSDEHYIPTLINKCCAHENSNRSITWVDWSKSGPHPGRFGRAGVSLEFLNQTRFNCTASDRLKSNDASSTCFLFGRKFMSDALRPLLQIAPMLLGLNASHF